MPNPKIAQAAPPLTGPSLLDLTASDLHAHAALGIDAALLAAAGVRRVTDAEARDILLQPKRSGDLSGIVYPYRHPKTGHIVAYRVRRDHPDIENGKPKNKYLTAWGEKSRLYFPPASGAKLVDTPIQIVIVEAEKSALAITAAATALDRPVLAVACGGCYGWKGKIGKVAAASGVMVDEYGPLPDLDLVEWTDRRVFVVFDSNAATNVSVQKARRDLVTELTARGARPRAITLPVEPGVNGPDDYIGAHGHAAVFALLDDPAEASTEDGFFTDARLADTFADAVLRGRYVWCGGLGWLRWTGTHWSPTTDERVGEALRRFALKQFTQAAQHGQTHERDGWYGLLKAARERAVLSLCRGIVERTADQFDAHPDLLNTRSGVVDLRTKTVSPHDPDLLLTKITKGHYHPDAHHPDWDQALTALPEDVRTWLQERIGQAATGHPTRDGRILIAQGGGENGKNAVLSAGILTALGDYAAPASPKLFAARSEHSTERADLRGQRFVLAEELTEHHALNVTLIKQISDVETITARRVHCDNMKFHTSHSLMVTTNYVPVVLETDHGTWRRLVLVVFPYTFRKPGEARTASTDRAGDPDLKARLLAGADGQHDAVVRWVVDGAAQWYAHGFSPLPPTVAADTRAWQRQADHLLGFWDACLVPTADACALTTEVCAAFTTWQRTSGHPSWTKEVFHPRFKTHPETLRHGVTFQRTKELTHLSRYLGATSAVADQAYVYLGVRFREAKDDPPEAPK